MRPGDAGSSGEPLISLSAVEAFHVDGVAPVGDVGEVFRTGLTLLWKTKKVINSAVVRQCVRRKDYEAPYYAPEEDV